MFELSPENQQYLNSAVASGAYPSAVVALDEAVLLLRRRDETRKKLEAAVLQAECGELIPAEQVFDRLEERARAIQARAPH